MTKQELAKADLAVAIERNYKAAWHLRRTRDGKGFKTADAPARALSQAVAAAHNLIEAAAAIEDAETPWGPR